MLNLNDVILRDTNTGLYDHLVFNQASFQAATEEEFQQLYFRTTMLQTITKVTIANLDKAKFANLFIAGKL
jgi:hypothetical protein